MSGTEDNKSSSVKGADIYSNVKDFCIRRNMFETVGDVVVGISGGADSVSLLLLLKRLIKGDNRKLYAVHVNHGIRGDEAFRDEEFCRRLCEREKVQLFVFHENIPELVRKTGMSEEEAGRRVRYARFTEICHKCGAGGIAVAHNSDDQTETILFNVVRGCGLTGLAGMKPVSVCQEDESLKIIRPLLETSRADIENYLREVGQEWCQDSTNEELEYTRNIVRHRIIPELKNLSTKAPEHIRSLGREAARADDFAEAAADRLFDRLYSDGVLFTDELLGKHDYLVRRLIYRYICIVTGKKKDITQSHVENVCGLLENTVGKMVCLPYDIDIVREYGCIKAYKRGIEYTEPEELIVSADSPLKAEISPGVYVEASFEDCDSSADVPQSENEVWLDAAVTGERLVLRKRCDGDYFCAYPDGRRKSVGRLFIDSRIPAAVRDSHLVLASGSRCFLIGNLRHDEAARINGNTVRILKVRFECREKQFG